MEEANEFLAGLDSKTIKKIFYNIDLAEQTNDSKLFKKLKMTFGNYGQNMVVFKSDYLHFGISRTIRKHW